MEVDNLSEASSSAEREHARVIAAVAAAAAGDRDEQHKSIPSSDHFMSAFHGSGLHQQEHEARVEALQVLNSLPKGMPIKKKPKKFFKNESAGSSQRIWMKPFFNGFARTCRRCTWAQKSAGTIEKVYFLMSWSSIGTRKKPKQFFLMNLPDLANWFRWNLF